MTVNIALFDDLDAVAEDAAGALDRGAQPCLFSRLDWFRLIHDHCPPPGSLAVLRGRDGERQAWLFLAADGRDAQRLCRLVFAALRRRRAMSKVTS